MTTQTVIFITTLIVGWSIAIDIHSYPERQTKWETLHPGATYTRGYRKLQRAMDKAARNGGEV